MHRRHRRLVQKRSAITSQAASVAIARTPVSHRPVRRRQAKLQGTQHRTQHRVRRGLQLGAQRGTRQGSRLVPASPTTDHRYFCLAVMLGRGGLPATGETTACHLATLACGAVILVTGETVAPDCRPGGRQRPPRARGGRSAMSRHPSGLGAVVLLLLGLAALFLLCATSPWCCSSLAWWHCTSLARQRCFSSTQ